MIATVPKTAVSIFGRLIERDKMTPEAANYLLSLTFTEKDHKRIASLADKAQEGTLTPQEHAELESFLEVDDILAVLQSKAKKSLRKTRAG